MFFVIIIQTLEFEPGKGICILPNLEYVQYQRLNVAMFMITMQRLSVEPAGVPTPSRSWDPSHHGKASAKPVEGRERQIGGFGGPCQFVAMRSLFTTDRYGRNAVFLGVCGLLEINVGMPMTHD